MLIPPGECAQRNAALIAPGEEVSARRSIDVNLPIHLRKRGEIVFSVDSHPRQPFATVDATGGADTKRPAAIVEGDLRNSAENKLANRVKCQDPGNDHGRDTRAHD